MSRQDNSLGFVEPEYDIGKAFDKIENELIASMIRNMDRHRAEELKEGYDWEMWQALQLKQLEKYKKLNAARFKGRFKDINSRIEDLIRESNKKGYLSEEIKILDAIKQGFFANRSEEALAGAFFRLNERKLNALVRATVKDMSTAETAILRMANDRYRRAIFDAQVYANTGAGTYEKAVDMATKDMLAAGLKCVEYSNGARHTLANYARMAIRTANKRAYLQGEGAKRREWGLSTVIVNKRGGACPLCLPFVGKVMIDDVWSGGKATDGPYMLLSSAIADGFYHPNCKDSHSTYFPMLDDNSRARFSIGELKEIEEDYRQEQLINYADRQVKKYTRLSGNSLDSENADSYRKKVKVWKNKLYRFIDKTTARSFSINQLPTGYRDEILSIIESANPIIKDMIKRNMYRITFANYEILGGAFYNKQGIFVNLSKDSMNRLGKFKSTFHELGHYIDDLESLTDGSKYFEQALYNDFHNLEKSIRNGYNLNQEEAYKFISSHLIKDSSLHSISDIVGGITDNACVGKWGHFTEDYWVGNKLKKEAFAHFFEATIRNDAQKLHHIEQVFPTAYDEFIKIIKGGSI